jgi:hypothetical protein
MSSPGNPSLAAAGAPAAGRYYRRFTRTERILHSVLMLTFVGCALTGLPLLFADQPWAATLARMLGGFELAGLIHRICAFFMLGMFACHLVTVIRRAIVNKNFLGIVWGPDSMVPQPQDAVDLYNHVKWFVGRGPQPKFDRWTYWEKFDYWAVFWGHGDHRRLGAAALVPRVLRAIPAGMDVQHRVARAMARRRCWPSPSFSPFHFYNGHVRPERFPMDTVIFTGRISEHELKHERAVEYERLRREGRLAAYEAPPPTLESMVWGWFVGGAALALGIVAIVLIAYSLLH